MDNQAAEALLSRLGKGAVWCWAMPRIDEGSEVYPVEALLEDPARAVAVLSRAVSCGCMLVDAPFVATVSRGSIVVDMAIGVASLVCGAGCGLSEWRLERPAWASGVRLEGVTCRLAGPRGVLDAVTGIGVSVVEVELEDVVEYAGKGVGAVAVLPGVESIEVERAPGFCGVIEATNPLLPPGVVGRQGYTGCIEEYARLVGPNARLLLPVLRLGRRPVMWLLRSLADALFVGYDPARSSEYLTLSFLLGLLYVSGERVE